MGDRRQILSFDALRAIAAVLVMSSHVRDVLLQEYRQGFGRLTQIFYIVTSWGHPAVIMFFVLSGYWITKAVVERQEAGAFTWSGYLLDRLTRLWVVLLPALVLGAAADFVTLEVLHFPPPNWGSQSILPHIETHYSLPYFAANVLFLQGLFAPTFGTNGPLWTLANEFWYYLWFPALHIAVATRRITVPAILALGTAILFHSFLPGFVCWLCGSALYLLSRRFGPVNATWGIIGWLPFVVFFFLDHDSGSGVHDIALALACILPFWRMKDWPLKKGPVAAYGAGSSYSLYAMHYPLLAVVVALLGLHERLRPSVLAIGACLALSAALILAAWGFSQLTERHTRRVRQWAGSLGRSFGPGGTAPELP
ncbi:MAG TPA: acyltransferase [Caulobacteraceae bacterium]|jgi:peptidoglycan/LPS O-acetylase OafA/YrhL